MPGDPSERQPSADSGSQGTDQEEGWTEDVLPAVDFPLVASPEEVAEASSLFEDLADLLYALPEKQLHALRDGVERQLSQVMGPEGVARRAMEEAFLAGGGTPEEWEAKVRSGMDWPTWSRAGRQKAEEGATLREVTWIMLREMVGMQARRAVSGGRPASFPATGVVPAPSLPRPSFPRSGTPAAPDTQNPPHASVGRTAGDGFAPITLPPKTDEITHDTFKMQQYELLETACAYLRVNEATQEVRFDGAWRVRHLRGASQSWAVPLAYSGVENSDKFATLCLGEPLPIGRDKSGLRFATQCMVILTMEHGLVQGQDVTATKGIAEAAADILCGSFYFARHRVLALLHHWGVSQGTASQTQTATSNNTRRVATGSATGARRATTRNHGGAAVASSRPQTTAPPAATAAPAPIRCFECNRIGHRRADCPQRTRQ